MLVRGTRTQAMFELERLKTSVRPKAIRSVCRSGKMSLTSGRDRSFLYIWEQGKISKVNDNISNNRILCGLNDKTNSIRRNELRQCVYHFQILGEFPVKTRGRQVQNSDLNH